jgi:hypothetical protein
MALTFKGLPNVRPLKIRMLRSESVEELHEIFDTIIETYRED